MAIAQDAPRKSALSAWVRALDGIKILETRPGVTLPGLLPELAARYRDRPALRDAATAINYQELHNRAGQYAQWVLAQGLAPGQAVALLMPNCADYPAIWLGISQAGCVVALLNINLTGAALLHSIRAAAATRLIAAATLLPAVEAISGELPGLDIWVHGEDAAYPRIDTEITRFAGAPTPDRAPAGDSTALLIYTSGTTGLPKAARVTHARIIEWSFWFAGMMDAQPTDCLYNCLPLYHSTGGVVAIGAMLVSGGAVLIRERFSVTKFWDDIVEGDCTIFQYIGELCRYLAYAPPHPREAEHSLRLACGNGMGAEVWERLQARFKIPQILEFYAATEGNVSLYNCEGKPGAIGRLPAFLAHRFPIALIRCDPETAEPLRDAAGFCIKCDDDEPGEAIGKIRADRPFDGYTDDKASAKKRFENVFAPNDCWFRTGDLMRKDKAGYYYFVDRLGDTFRWKGENVSTAQVAETVSACPGVTEAVVFGVNVPGHEGRAGMAAITIDGDFRMPALQAHLAGCLPDYARPIFVRLCNEIEATGTFKLKKDRLAKEGFCAIGTDMVWFHDRNKNAMIACDKALRDELNAGKISRL